MKNYKLTIISCVGIDGLIGNDNELLYKIKEDLIHFRKTTINHTLIVGYNTFINLPKKALENRKYILYDYSENIYDDNVIKCNSINEIFNYLDNNCNDDEIFVIGGSEIYKKFINYTDNAIITWVNKISDYGNKFFPIDELFNKFIVVEDSNWIKSENNLLYKITKYVKE